MFDWLIKNFFEVKKYKSGCAVRVVRTDRNNNSKVISRTRPEITPINKRSTQYIRSLYNLPTETVLHDYFVDIKGLKC